MKLLDNVLIEICLSTLLLKMVFKRFLLFKESV